MKSKDSNFTSISYGEYVDNTASSFECVYFENRTIDHVYFPKYLQFCPSCQV